MSSYVERAMHGDEKIVYAAQLHWIIYQSGFFYTIFGALLGHTGSGFIKAVASEKIAEYILPMFSYFSFGVVALGALLLVFAYIRQISTELVVTNQRVIAKHGFISTTSYELMMTKVEGATIDQSIWGRMWGYGTLMVKGTGGGISPIDHVAEPYKFHNSLMSAIQAATENGQNNNHKTE